MKFYEIVLNFEVFFFCLFFSFAANYIILKYSKSTGILLDKGNINKPQRMHFGDTPRAGGIGIFLGVVFAIFFGLEFDALLLLFPVILVFASGILEDLHNSLSPKKRLFLQFLSAIVVVWLLDCVITDIGFILPYWLGFIFSVFCIIGIINAMNIIDGFNGLSSGVALMVFVSIAIVAYIVGDKSVLYFSVAMMGASLGFLLINFPKGHIFLGDGGAYLLGFMLAYLLINLTQTSPFSDPAKEVSRVSAYYALCVMIYPVFEVLFSIYRRKIMREDSAMSPDSLHLHSIVYKRLRRENYKTSIFIWLLNVPFVFVPILFFDDDLLLIGYTFLFMGLYLFIYFKIVKFGSLKL